VYEASPGDGPHVHSAWQEKGWKCQWRSSKIQDARAAKEVHHGYVARNSLAKTKGSMRVSMFTFSVSPLKLED